MIQKFIEKHRILLFDALLTLWILWMLISEWIQHASVLHLILYVASYAAMMVILIEDIQHERGKRGFPRLFFTVSIVVLFVALALYLLSLIVAAVK